MKEKPTFEIEFNTPQEVKLMYGFKKKVIETEYFGQMSRKSFSILFVEN